MCEFEKAKSTLSFFDVDYEEPGLRKNFESYERNKESLINLLRKHPNWNEEAKAVILTAKESRLVDFDVATNTFCALKNKCVISEAAAVLNKVFWRDWYLCKNLTEAMVGWLDENNVDFGFRYSVGQKTSRFMKKLFAFSGLDMENDPENRRLFAAYADALSTYDVERPFVLSANFSDYLSMSYGKNWCSCHIINPKMSKGGENYSGCYKAGTLSYANDPVSLISYTVEKLPSDINDLPTTPRMTRQMFYVDTKQQIMLQSRMYPYTNDNECRTLYREIVQGILAKCFDVDNLWKTESGRGVFYQHDRMHYADYEYSQYNPKFSYLQSTNKDNLGDVGIGDSVYCLECGHTHQDETSLSCKTCRGVKSCAHCGQAIDTENDDYREDSNGNVYCADDDCCFYCGDCREWHDVDDRNYVSTYDSYVCDSCLCNYVECEVCGELIRESGIFEVDNTGLCESCARQESASCKSCGEIHLISNMRQIGDFLYCEDCVEEERKVS